MTAALMAEQQPGAPIDGDFYKQSMAPVSRLGEILYDVLNNPDHSWNWKVKMAILIVLLRSKERKATQAQTLAGVQALSYIARMSEDGTPKDKEKVTRLLRKIESHLYNSRQRYDVTFPTEDYRILGTQPTFWDKNDDNAKFKVAKWKATFGREMEVEEQDPEGEPRYDCDYTEDLEDWSPSFDGEYDYERSLGTRTADYVFVVPPGQEKIIARRLYQDLDGRKKTDHAPASQTVRRAKNHFSRRSACPPASINCPPSSQMRKLSIPPVTCRAKRNFICAADRLLAVVVCPLS